MSDELNKKLQENFVRRILPSFLQDAARRLGRPESSLVTESVFQTNVAFNHYGMARAQVVQDCTAPGRYCLTTYDREAVLLYAAQLVQSLPDCQHLLFLEDSPLCGAIHTTRHEVLSKISLRGID